jgi:hypothetical protein
VTTYRTRNLTIQAWPYRPCTDADTPEWLQGILIHEPDGTGTLVCGHERRRVITGVWIAMYPGCYLATHNRKEFDYLFRPEQR